MHSIALVGNVCPRRLDHAFLHYLGGLRVAMEHSLYSTLAATQFLVVVESNKGPLGPLCFALTLQPIIEKLKREVPDLSINTWYLDDGTLCSSPEDLSAALKIIEEDGPQKGLHLNRSKSLLYIPADGDASLNTLPVEIPVARVGFSLLGSPIGPASYCESTTSQRVAKIHTAVKRLRDLEDAQVELTLLWSCLALPKFNYKLRTCPPAFIHQDTAFFDTIMREALSDMAGSPLSDWAWEKATLPTTFGGLVLRLGSLHAPVAFLCSVAASLNLVQSILGYHPIAPPQVQDSVLALAEVTKFTSWRSIDDIDVPISQHQLSRTVDEARFDSFLQFAPDERSRALALSTSLAHVGDWLNVLPSPSLGLTLHNQDL